jgi:hypothetical protein
MTFSGFIKRIVFVCLLTWILVAFIDSFGWALYFALLPVAFYEALRPRPPR